MLRRALPLLLIPLLAAGGLLAAEGPTELRLSRFNRVYEDLAGDLRPIEAPPVVIRLSSPSQRLLVKENVARLSPLGGGRFAGTVELELLGKGRLIADVELGGIPQRLEDEVLLPRQRLEIAGVARIERVAGGYRVVAEELPPSIRVEIRSQLVNQLLGLCAGASILSLGSLDCASVEQALQRPEIPLSGQVAELFLGDGDLTEDERQTLDDLLAGR